MIRRSNKADDVEVADKHREEYQRQLELAFQDFNPQGKYVHTQHCPHPSLPTGEIQATDRCDCAQKRANEAVEDFIGRTNTALERSVGSKVVRKGFSRSWFDQELREAVLKRRAAYKTWTETKLDADYKKFTALRKNCRKLTRVKKKEKWEEYLDDLESAYKGDHKRLWKLVKRLIPDNGKTTVSPIDRSLTGPCNVRRGDPGGVGSAPGATRHPEGRPGLGCGFCRPHPRPG